MMRSASSLSAGGVVARQIVVRIRHSARTLSFRIRGELEMNFWKRAKAADVREHLRTLGLEMSLPKGAAPHDHYFGGSESILSRMLTVSRIVLPTISRLLGLSLSTVSCGVLQKTLL